MSPLGMLIRFSAPSFIGMLLLQLLFSSSSSVFVFSQQTTISDQNDIDKFYWPNTENNVNGGFTFANDILLQNSRNIKQLEITESPNQQSTFTIDNCRIGTIVINNSLTNVILHVKNSDIGRFVVGSNSALITFINTKLIIENNVFTQETKNELLLPGNPEMWISENRYEFSGVLFFSNSQERVALGDGTQLRILNNLFNFTNEPWKYVAGGGRADSSKAQFPVPAIFVEDILITGYTEDISIRFNRVYIANFTQQSNDKIEPISISLCFLDAASIARNPGGFLFQKMPVSAPIIQRRYETRPNDPPLVGSRAWIFSDNYVNFTVNQLPHRSFDSTASDEENKDWTIDARLLSVHLNNLYHVPLVEMSRNYFVYRADPFLLRTRDYIKALNFGNVHGTVRPGCEVLNISEGFFQDDNILVTEAVDFHSDLSQSVIDQQLKYAIERLDRIAWLGLSPSLRVLGKYDSTILSSSSWLRRDVPIGNSVNIVRLWSKCYFGWRDVRTISQSNNSIPGEFRAIALSPTEYTVTDCIRRSSSGVPLLINVSNNFVFNNSVGHRHAGCSIDTGHLQNVILVAENNYANVEDRVSARTNAKGVKFEMGGRAAHSKCHWWKDKYDIEPENDPNFFAFADNVSIYIRNNFFILASSSSTIALDITQDDLFSEGGYVPGDTLYYNKGRLDLVEVANNTVFTRQNNTLVTFTTVIEPRDAVSGQLLVHSMSLFTPLKNVSLAYVHDNNFWMDATTGDVVANIGMSWATYNQTGTVLIERNNFTMLNVFSVQPSTAVASISRTSIRLPETDVGPFLVFDNNFELQIDPRYGCSALGCNSIQFTVGNASYNMDVVNISGNRFYVNNSFGIGASALAFVVLPILRSQPVPAPIFQRIIVTENGLLENFTGIVFSHNSVEILAVARVTAVSIVVGGDLIAPYPFYHTVSSSSNNNNNNNDEHKKNLLHLWQRSNITLDGNTIRLETTTTTTSSAEKSLINTKKVGNLAKNKNIFANQNAVLYIGAMLSVFTATVPDFAIPVVNQPMTWTTIFGSRIEAGTISIKNSNIVLRGGFPGVIAIASNLSIGGALEFRNVTIDNVVTATEPFTSMFEKPFLFNTFYEKETGPFGVCRGLINVMEEDVVGRPENKFDLWLLGGGNSRATKTAATSKNNNNKNDTLLDQQIIITDSSFDFTGSTIDTGMFDWRTNGNAFVGSTLLETHEMNVLIRNSTFILRKSVGDNPRQLAQQPSVIGNDNTKRSSGMMVSFPASENLPSVCDVTVVNSTLAIDSVADPNYPQVAFDLSKVPSSSSASTSIRRNLHITNDSKVIFTLDPSSAASSTASPILVLMNTKSAPGSFIIANSSIIVESSSPSSSSLSLRAADVGDSVRDASKTWPLVYTSSSEPGPTALRQPNEDPSSSSSSSLSLFSVSLLNATLYLPANPDQAQVFSSSSSPASGGNSNNNNNLFFSSNLAFSAQCTNFANSNKQQQNQQQREQATVVLRPSSVFYTTAVQLARKGADIAVCEKSATKSLSRSVSVVPTCSRYALLYAGDRRHTVVQATGRTLRVTVALVTGSELLPLIAHPETPKRDVPLTQPPAGQAQSEAFTVFRQGHNVTSSPSSSPSSSASSSSPPLLYSVNPEVAAARWAYTHVIDGATQQRIEDQQQRQARATLMTLEVRVAAGLRSNRDHTVEIAVSPTLLACMTPEIIPVAASSNTSSSSSSSRSSSRFLPVFSSPRGDGWPVVRFTLHRREVGAQPLLGGQMASLSRGAAIAAAGLTGNSMMMSQMNRAETMYRFLDCGFSDEEPLDAIQSPVQIGVGDAQQPGYYQRAAILGNLLMMLLVLLALLGIGLVKWKKRQPSYVRKLAAHKAQLLQRRLQRQGAAIDLNKRRRQSSIMKEKGHDEKNDLKSTSLLSASSPVPAAPPSSSSATPPPPPPPLSLVQTLYSVCLPSHTHVAVLGLLQGTVAAAVALLRINGFSGSDAFLAMFALIFTLLFFVWMVYIVLYVLPRHRYVTYIERSSGDGANNTKQDGSGDRRQVYGPSKWFPKCPNCAPLSQVVEPEDNSTRHARRIVPRIQLQRFAAYRALKWFLTPWGDWTLFRTPVKPEIKKPSWIRSCDECCADEDDEDTHRGARLQASSSSSSSTKLAKKEIPDCYFRERTDKILDDYTFEGRYFGLIEYGICYVIAVAAGVTPESNSATDESCTTAAVFALIVNVIPFAYTIAISPFRKKTLLFFGLVTGAILVGMSVLVGLSKMFDLQFLTTIISYFEVGLEFSSTFKLGFDMIDMFWIFEVETLFIPLHFLRHYVFHFKSSIRGLQAMVGGRKYPTMQEMTINNNENENELTYEEEEELLENKKVSNSREDTPPVDDDGEERNASRLSFTTTASSNLRNRRRYPRTWSVNKDLAV